MEYQGNPLGEQLYKGRIFKKSENGPWEKSFANDKITEATKKYPGVKDFICRWDGEYVPVADEYYDINGRLSQDRITSEGESNLIARIKQDSDNRKTQIELNNNHDSSLTEEQQLAILEDYLNDNYILASDYKYMEK